MFSTGVVGFPEYFRSVLTEASNLEPQTRGPAVLTEE